MVDESKVRLMTKLEIYEKHEKSRNLILSRYYKSDYVRLNVLKTWIASTVVYWTIIAIYVMMTFDDILAEINDMDYFGVMYKLLGGYVIYCVIYFVFAQLLYSYRYSKAKPGLIKYNSNLKDLIELQGGPIHRTRMVTNSDVKQAREGQRPNEKSVPPKNRVNRSQIVQQRQAQQDKVREQQIIENAKRLNERAAMRNEEKTRQEQEILAERQRIQQRRMQLEREQMERIRQTNMQQMNRVNHTYQGMSNPNGQERRDN
ncbi:MAG: hypothetical protein E7258_07260 [Lachnospiraceae bacterium]|nr:hypothetical protein [Lachnospiraceae bacterium]